MPELPEVETTRRGIAPHVLGQTVAGLTVRDGRLRWPVPATLGRILPDQQVRDLSRRAKYLIFKVNSGALILHLGMSGSLRVVPKNTPPQIHDHVDIVFGNGLCLRLRDPRRFGALLWTEGDPLAHPLLRDLGPEPWDAGFDGAYLHRRARGRGQAVKAFLMDSKTVAGIGNIYANESLHRAGIHPGRPAGRIAAARYEGLAVAVRQVLEEAIRHGGTTLRDFQDSEGRPGYFRHELRVYARAAEVCLTCAGPIHTCVIGQRASYFCPQCQR